MVEFTLMYHSFHPHIKTSIIGLVCFTVVKPFAATVFVVPVWKNVLDITANRLSEHLLHLWVRLVFAVAYSLRPHVVFFGKRSNGFALLTQLKTNPVPTRHGVIDRN